MKLVLQIKGTKDDGTIEAIYPDRSSGKQTDKEIENTAVGWGKLKEKSASPIDSPFTSIHLWSHGEKIEEVTVNRLPETSSLSADMTSRIKQLYQDGGRGAIFVDEGSNEEGEYTTLAWIEEVSYPEFNMDGNLIETLKAYNPDSQYVLVILPKDGSDAMISVNDL
jgi:hypothetical protein